MFGNNVVGDISEISTFCHLGSAVPIDQMLGLINGYGLARAFKQQVPTVYLAKKLFFSLASAVFTTVASMLRCNKVYSMTK